MLDESDKKDNGIRIAFIRQKIAELSDPELGAQYTQLLESGRLDLLGRDLELLGMEEIQFSLGMMLPILPEERDRKLTPEQLANISAQIEEIADPLDRQVQRGMLREGNFGFLYDDLSLRSPFLVRVALGSPEMIWHYKDLGAPTRVEGSEEQLRALIEEVQAPDLRRAYSELLAHGRRDLLDESGTLLELHNLKANLKGLLKAADERDRIQERARITGTISSGKALYDALTEPEAKIDLALLMEALPVAVKQDFFHVLAAEHSQNPKVTRVLQELVNLIGKPEAYNGLTAHEVRAQQTATSLLEDAPESEVRYGISGYRFDDARRYSESRDNELGRGDNEIARQRGLRYLANTFGGVTHSYRNGSRKEASLVEAIRACLDSLDAPFVVKAPERSKPAIAPRAPSEAALKVRGHNIAAATAENASASEAADLLLARLGLTRQSGGRGSD